MNHAHWPTGTKVLCINDTFHPAVFEFFDRVPVKGEVYTVCGHGTARRNGCGPVGPYIRLAEVLPIDGVSKAGFGLWHFSSLTEAPEEASQCLDAQGATCERATFTSLRQ